MKPFYYVPWERDFLDCLGQRIQEGGPAIVIFMHNRPKRYLRDWFCKQGRTSIVPQMFTGAELQLKLGHYYGLEGKTTGILSQVALLERCVQSIPQLRALPLASLDQGGFFAWGMHLAKLLEECMAQGVEPQDMEYVEGEVLPFGAELLGAMGQIFRAYVQLLAEKNLTTPGLWAYQLGQKLIGQEIPEFLQVKSVYVAVSGVFTRTEDQLFHWLWQGGASLFLPWDRELSHWSGRHFQELQKRWRAGAEVLEETGVNESGVVGTSKVQTQELKFFAGYDLHSQLEVLRHDLVGMEQSSRAIVLPHSAALLPVLHHIASTDCNISLGYPLERSLLFNLIQLILQLQNSVQPDGYYHRDVLGVLGHPYLRLLPGLREELDNLERKLRAGSRFVNLQSESEALTQLFEVLNFKEVQTLRDLAQALGNVGQYLLQAGAELWDSFPLDSEAMFRLLHQVVPELRDNELSDKELPWSLLQEICLQLLREEHVPFEADPLTGLQVLGMLETRLLHFEQIYLLEATDDYLPGRASPNPLLPDSLRELIGLPDVSEREQLTAYTFYRLLAGAKKIFIYWQEGVESQGLFEAKKQRSRLVEELIWKLEKQAGQRLQPGNGIWRVANPKMLPPVRERQAVLKTPAIQKRLQEFLAKPISASSLDVYLRCPLCFYYQVLCKLKPLGEVKEDDDPASVGELLHKVLYDFYNNSKGKWLEAVADLSESEVALELGRLREIFQNSLDESDLLFNLPPESATMLQLSGLERLIRFWRTEPKRQVVSLEKTIKHTFAGINQEFQLLGKLDRVDLREGLVILDYKTGKIKESPAKSKLWDKELWSDLVSSSYDYEEDSNYLPEINKLIPSLQLMFYAYLFNQDLSEGQILHEAYYISLGEDGKGYPLFEGRSQEQKNQALQEYIPGLLRYILGHLCLYPSFEPQEGWQCDSCVYANLCLN